MISILCTYTYTKYKQTLKIINKILINTVVPMSIHKILYPYFDAFETNLEVFSFLNKIICQTKILNFLSY